MLALAFLVVLALSFLNSCSALGGLRYIRPPPPARSLRQRAIFESIDAGIVNFGNSTNSTTPTNAAIVPVVLSEADQ